MSRSYPRRGYVGTLESDTDSVDRDGYASAVYWMAPVIGFTPASVSVSMEGVGVLPLSCEGWWMVHVVQYRTYCEFGVSKDTTEFNKIFIRVRYVDNSDGVDKESIGDIPASFRTVTTYSSSLLRKST